MSSMGGVWGCTWPLAIPQSRHHMSHTGLIRGVCQWLTIMPVLWVSGMSHMWPPPPTMFTSYVLQFPQSSSCVSHFKIVLNTNHHWPDVWQMIIKFRIMQTSNLFRMKNHLLAKSHQANAVMRVHVHVSENCPSLRNPPGSPGPSS